jgi:DNA mismatch endonuclease (patch repair protein)
MKANRAKNTTPELALRRLLRKRGLTGYKTVWKHAPGHPDVAFPAKKIAVFLNGCYWHRCPYCSLPLPKSNQPFWRRKFQLNKERDTRKARELRMAGWKVYTVWECFLTRRPNRLESVLRDVSGAYAAATATGTHSLLTDVGA